MFRFTRRVALAAIAALALSACGQAGGEDVATTPSTPEGSSVSDAALKDVIIGDPNAPVTMIEYASWTCPACLNFDQTVMPMIKSDYIETGKVRFVFREFPTAPANIAVAGFAIARCAGEDKYYEVIDELFERQAGILAMVRQGDQVKSALMQIAENHGISGEDAFEACLQDGDIRRAISTAVGRGDASGVNSTPTVFVNGEMLEGYDWRYPEGMRLALDEALGVSPSDDASVEDAIPADTSGE
ncbi:MAG: DsbA family protein [Henriciella sp.]|nr:DsbA family protein [Henriciella sp.]